MANTNIYPASAPPLGSISVEQVEPASIDSVWQDCADAIGAALVRYMPGLVTVEDCRALCKSSQNQLWIAIHRGKIVGCAISGLGTYTTPAATSWIRVVMVGGGGGSGGAGQGSPSNGGAGGDTIFNSIHAAGGLGGGTAGGGAGAGGAGGASGTGSATLRVPGSAGGIGSNTAASSLVQGGCGGSSILGGGLQGQLTNAGVAGVAGSAPGAGAAGGGSAGLTAGSGGGGAGEYVELIINAPSATYAYTVGASGSAGVGNGTGTANGAFGTPGIIIVFEYH